MFALIELSDIIMKHLITMSLMVAAGLLPLSAAENDSVVRPSLKVRAEARMDYNNAWIDGKVDHSESGFNMNGVNIYLDGNLNRHFSYALKERIDKIIDKGNLLDATPWVYLTYRPDDNWEFSAGKEVVCIGGFEYDRSPINIYFASVYWNNIACYQLGVSAAYRFGANDKLTLQAVQSPFHTSEARDIYGYNLQWNGRHGIWTSIWSLNMSEYARGHFINYISLGNRFDIDAFSLELDFMNRATRHHTFLFSDCSVMADAGVQATKWLRPFAKYTYDVNKKNHGDLCVVPGTELNTLGAGFQAWPLRKNNMEVKLHADACYSWGKNPAAGALMVGKRWWLDLGVTWSMTLCDI